MRVLLIVALFLMVLATGGCYKKAGPHKDDGSIYGNWHWLQTAGGFGGLSYNATPDSVVVLNLHDYGRFEQTVNGHLQFEGTFRLDSILNIPGPPQPAISFAGMRPEFIYERNDTLVLEDQCCDGFDRIYVRVF